MTDTDATTSRRYSLLPTPLADFLETETSGGIVLLGAALVALVWANSPWGSSYFDLWERHLHIGIGGFAIDERLLEWVNDGLMAVFFFVSGLEIKRELVVGELRDPRRAALPALGALGGMVVPAVIFTVFNAGGPGAKGWGTPMATDIAFAVGVVALLGPRVPRGLKLFLLTLAIVDDLGAIAVIAVFYTGNIDFVWLGGAVASIAVIVAMQRLGVRRPAVYALPAAILWVCMLESGVHATIAGVATGLLTPARPYRGREVIPPLEHSFHPWSSFLIVPVFALANAGVELSGEAVRAALTSRVTLGIVVGLVLGKTIGVTGAAFLAVKARLGRLPEGVGSLHMLGAGAIAGIGFTVALFVAELSFDQELLAEAKIGILSASLIAGIAGTLILRAVGNRAVRPEPEQPSPL